MSNIRRSIILFLLALLLFSLIFIILYLHNETSRENMTVAFLDIGQGDAVYVEAPNGNRVLIDGGPTAMVVRRLSNILPFYDKRIDMLMVTHHDLDHTGGFTDVFKRYQVGQYVTSHWDDDDALFYELEKLSKEEGSDRVVLQAGDRVVLGSDVYIDILWPPEGKEFDSNNDSSIITRVVYGDTAFMLTGDAPKEVENRIVNVVPDLNSNVLKAGHHGSKTSTSVEFFDATSPEFVIVSAGLDNKFGHPHQEVLDVIGETKILETFASSTIIFESNGEEVWLVD